MTSISSRDDPSWRQARFAAMRDKRALQLLLLRCGIAFAETISVAGGVSYHGRQRPLTARDHRGDNRCLCPMGLILSSGGRGPCGGQGCHCCYFDRWCCVNHGLSTVGASLEFRRIAKGPVKGDESRNRTSATLHCKPSGMPHKGGDMWHFRRIITTPANFVRA